MRLPSGVRKTLILRPSCSLWVRLTRPRASSRLTAATVVGPFIRTRSESWRWVSPSSSQSARRKGHSPKVTP